MISKWTSRKRMVGLDIGHDVIKAAQVTPDAKGAKLDGVLSIRRSKHSPRLEKDEIEVLAHVMERRGMLTDQAVLVAPTNALVSSSINVPAKDAGTSRDQIVEMELSRTQGLEVGGFEYAWWDLPPSSGGGRHAQAHAIALPHEAVMPTIDSLAQLGIEVKRTVPASLALVAAAQRVPVDPRRISAILDLGSNRTHLTLMHTGRVVHERELVDFNLSAIYKELTESLHLDHATLRQALAHFGLTDVPEGNVDTETTNVLGSALGPLTEEIGLSFSYVSHMYPQAELGPLFLVGGGANMRGLSKRIWDILELEVVVLTPERLMQSDCVGAESTDPALTTAVGAALLSEDAA